MYLFQCIFHGGSNKCSWNSTILIFDLSSALACRVESILWSLPSPDLRYITTLPRKWQLYRLHKFSPQGRGCFIIITVQNTAIWRSFEPMFGSCNLIMWYWRYDNDFLSIVCCCGVYIELFEVHLEIPTCKGCTTRE